MTAMTLDEFFDLAQLGGQIKACHDIFEILLNNDMGEDEKSLRLGEYQTDCVEQFKKAQLKFHMANGKIRTDEESIDSLE